MPLTGQYSAALTAQALSEPLRQDVESLVTALRSRPGAAWDQLLSAPVSDDLRHLFARARGEDASPFVLPSDIVFPDHRYPIEVVFTTREQAALTIADAEHLQMLRQVLSGEWRDQPEGGAARELAGDLQDLGVLVAPAPALACERPGIYRLQHASVLYRSASGTGVVVDPVAGFAEPSWLSPLAITGVDAILVSHSHGDHFEPLTLMQFPRDTTIVVPDVPRTSMLCPDMAAILRDAGFTNVIAAPWFSRVRIKDVDVRVYPFYGEQPWLSFAAPVADLRNHGNTYVVEMDGCKSWLLVDSGQEHGQAMAALCETVLRDVGSVDLVMSNLRSFSWHPRQIDGSGRYLFCFPENVLSCPDAWPTGSMTLGPGGVHELLSILEPRCFLPYAHWWHPLERTPHPVDSTHDEADLLAAVRDSGGPLMTELRPWQVGDRLTWRDRALLVTPALG
jgi:beta-lactamase family protein